MTCGWSSKGVDLLQLRRSIERREIGRSQVEACKIESGRHGAADQRPGAEAPSPLPVTFRNYGLRAFTGSEIGTEVRGRDRSSGGLHFKHQWSAGVVVPALGGIDGVPV